MGLDLKDVEFESRKRSISIFNEDDLDKSKGARFNS
jgi:hypothetical protein